MILPDPASGPEDLAFPFQPFPKSPPIKELHKTSGARRNFLGPFAWNWEQRTLKPGGLRRKRMKPCKPARFQSASAPLKKRPRPMVGANGGGCKPSSVRPLSGRMVICLGWLSPATSSSLPAATPRSLTLPQGWSVWVTPRRLFGLAPTGGCHAVAVASDAVGSYPTFSPLPRVAFSPRGLSSTTRRFVFCGPSVACRRPGVTWQSTRWSSDFPRWPHDHRDHHTTSPPP
jgi:hypothetical protein